MTAPTALADAYRECERITREQARNFSWGIRLLPGPKRTALSAVYALARRIDDIADGAGSPDEKLRGLAQARADLAAVGSARDDPVLVALADAAARFPVPLDAFGDLIDGAEMDVRGTRYETFDELVVYCRRVAGSIGRLSLGIFGASDLERAGDLGDDLGVALQLTNILRDVREDWQDGRVYLPRGDLVRFGVEPPELSPELIRFEAARAQEWFDRGLELLPLLDRPSAASVSAMAGIYRRLLERIAREPELVLRDERLSLTGWEKGWVAARSLAGAGA